MSKTIKKRKPNLFTLILISLFLSILLLYLFAVGLWLFYGYKKALLFYLDLLKANHLGFAALNETIFTYLRLPNISASFNDAQIAATAQELINTGEVTLKEILSGFFSEDFVVEILEKSSSFLHSSYLFCLQSGVLFILVAKIFFFKILLLIAALPLFALLGVVGLVDGLSQRDLRRAELGRESSYLFHLLNKWLFKIIIVGLCLWICIPLILNPQWFFVSLGLLFSIMLSLSASKFKKYL